jgi:hypothetical protein
MKVETILRIFLIFWLFVSAGDGFLAIQAPKKSKYGESFSQQI